MYVLKNGQVDVLIQNGKVNLIQVLSTSMYIFVSRAGNIKKPF
ncbi:Dihydroorotase [Listeria monocytogenes N53-1]|nr:Dihydroorotase [Listeria monocytogenes N53-1]